MNELRHILEMALDALKIAYVRDMSSRKNEYYSPAIDALRKALAEPELEPVAWLSKSGKGIWFHAPDATLDATPLYTTPPQLELNKNLSKDAENALREFGLKVAEEVAKGVDYSWGERKPQLIKIVDEVMKK